MQILRYTAFSADPNGGNPAGVVLNASGASDEAMLGIAADLGYSETAFLTPLGGDGGDGGGGSGLSGSGSVSGGGGLSGSRRFGVRYFSPRAEVPFCGHATIASAVAYAERHGTGALSFDTLAGQVDVSTARDEAGLVTATLVSVPPCTELLDGADLAELLAALRWAPDDLDRTLPVRVAFAGAWHPVVAAATRRRLADLDYDVPALDALMTRQAWTTIDLVWRESDQVFHARNPFPPGGVVEDPATGSAAAALGGYLRELGLVVPPARFIVHQGHDMGRPGLLTVDIPPGPESGIQVSGTAVVLPA